MLRPTTFLAAVVFALGATAAERAPATQSNSAPVVPVRVCYGGLEDGKIIVRSEQAGNNAAKTTLNVCRINGGSIVRAPQSPTLAAKRDTIA